ncbi:MAG: hypothetical protein NVS3B7_15170 [Candidatus Elarobacter sp.]
MRTLVEAESLSNDGVALVLFGSAVALAMGEHVSIGAGTLGGIAEVAGGIVIGAATAVVCAVVMRLTDAPEYEVTITVVLAYGAYLAASSVHASGIFATATGAIVMRAALARMPAALRNADGLERVWSSAAFIANAVVFLATGLLIRPDRVAHEPVLVLAAVAIVMLARAALALVATRDGAGRATVFLAGMRGALPLALALSLPDALPFRPQIIDATFAVVLVTIVVQGAPLEHVLPRLFRTPSDDAPPS